MPKSYDTVSVLIADGSSSILSMTRFILGEFGISKITTVTHSHHVLDELSLHPIDLLIVDWNMEPMTGLDLLKAIRGANNKVPFIMVTAESKTENVLAARQAGVNNYIVKPFNADTLKSKIESVLGDTL